MHGAARSKLPIPADTVAASCFFLTVTLLAGSWGELSRLRYAGIAAALGLVRLWARQAPSRSELRTYALFALTQLPALASVALFQEPSEVVYHVLISGTLFPFIASYLGRFGMDGAGLLALGAVVIPYAFPEEFGARASFIPGGARAGGYEGRFVGLTKDPNYTALGLMPAYVALLFGFSRTGPLLKAVLGGMLGLVMFAVLATGSRAGIGAVVVGLLVFVAIVRGKTRRWLLAALTLAGLGLYAADLGVAEYLAFFMNRINGGSGLFEDSRYEMWASALSYVLSASPISFTPESAVLRMYGLVVHNFLLDLGLYYGSLTMFIHAIAWTIGFVVLARSCWRGATEGKSLAANLPAFAFVFSLTVMLVGATLTVGTTNLYWFVYMFMWAVARGGERASRAPMSQLTSATSGTREVSRGA